MREREIEYVSIFSLILHCCSSSRQQPNKTSRCRSQLISTTRAYSPAVISDCLVCSVVTLLWCIRIVYFLMKSIGKNLCYVRNMSEMKIKVASFDFTFVHDDDESMMCCCLFQSSAWILNFSRELVLLLRRTISPIFCPSRSHERWIADCQHFLVNWRREQEEFQPWESIRLQISSSSQCVSYFVAYHTFLGK